VPHEKHGSRLHVVLQIYTISSPLRRETTLFHRVSSRRKCLDSRIINPKPSQSFTQSLSVHRAPSNSLNVRMPNGCHRQAADLFGLRFNRPSTISAAVLSISQVSTTLRQLLARDPFLAERKGKESYILLGETFTACRIYLARREILRACWHECFSFFFFFFSLFFFFFLVFFFFLKEYVVSFFFLFLFFSFHPSSCK